MTAYEAALQEMVKRIDELESAASIAKTSLISDNTSLRVLRERIEALEVSVQCEKQHYVMREEDRVERWHATYNAALTQLAQGRDADETAWEVNVHMRCAQYADRAHGPLEVKVTPRPDINIAGVTVGQVNALVEVADHARNWARREGLHGLVEALDAALIPFEAAK